MIDYPFTFQSSLCTRQRQETTIVHNCLRNLSPPFDGDSEIEGGLGIIGGEAQRRAEGCNALLESPALDIGYPYIIVYFRRGWV